MKIISTSFRISKKYHLTKLFSHTLIFDIEGLMDHFMTNDQESLRKRLYSIKAHISHLHNNSQVELFVKNGKISDIHAMAVEGDLFSNVKYDFEYFKNLLKTSNRHGNLVSFMKDIQIKEVGLPDHEALEPTKRYYNALFYVIARGYYYIPLEFFHNLQGNRWIPTSKSPSTEKIDSLSGTDYSVQSSFQTKVILDETNDPIIFFDLSTWAYNSSNLLNTIYKMLGHEDLTEDDLDDEKIQMRLEQRIRSLSPNLQTTYDDFTIGVSSRQKGKVVQIKWNQNLKNIEGGSLNGKKHDSWNYHKLLGNKLTQDVQPVIYLNLGPSDIPFPAELLREIPNLSFLKRIGLSDRALDLMKPDDKERMTILLNLISPFNEFLSTDPVLYEGHQVEHLYLETKQSNSTTKVPLYDRFSNITRFFSIGDFTNLTIAKPKNLSPKLEHSINKIIQHFEKTLPKIYKNNKINTNFVIKEVNYENLDVAMSEMGDTSISLWFLFGDSDLKKDEKWVQLKKLSVKHRHLTQLIDIDKFEDTKADSQIYYLNNLIRQIFYKSGGETYRVHNSESSQTILYIGIDRIPSREEKTGLDTGAVMMMNTGKYIGGIIHNYPDARKNDQIDVSSLFTKDFQTLLLDKLHKHKIDHVVVLRDSGPRSWMEETEIMPLKDFFSSNNISFSFVAVNKNELHRFYNIESSKPQYVNSNINEIFNQINIFPIKSSNPTRWSSILRKFNSGLRQLGVDLSLPVPLYVEHPFDEHSFYLQTTKPTAGTKTSVRYHILYTDLDLDDLKEQLKGDLSALCKAVEESIAPTSLPAPVHYANKLARWLHRTQVIPPTEFIDKVFYA
jgi:hypothetical protein